MDLRTRLFGIGCIVGVTIGSALVIVGDQAVTTVGVVAVILGLVSLLLAVGYFISDEEDEESSESAGSVEYS